MHFHKLLGITLLTILTCQSNSFAQRNQKISFFERHSSVTTSYTNGTSSTNYYNTRTFSLGIGSESELEAQQKRVGFLGSKIKPHLSLDPKVQGEFRTFKVKNSIQYIGTPIGFGLFGLGLASESENPIRSYAFYGSGLIVAGISYFIGVKSWNHLRKAISFHNNEISEEQDSSYNFSLQPKLITVGNSDIASVGLNLRLIF